MGRGTTHDFGQMYLLERRGFLEIDGLLTLNGSRGRPWSVLPGS